MQCPKCGQAYEFESKQTGQIFTCLECGETFRIEPSSSAGGAESELRKNNRQSPAGPERRRAGRSLLIGLSVAGGALVLIALIVGVVMFASGGDSGKKPPENAPETSLDSEIRQCIASGNVLQLSKLLQGVDPNATDENSETLLWPGVRSGNREVVQALLTAGFQLNITNRQGESVLLEAVRRHDLAMLEFLVGKGAKLEAAGHSSETAWGIASENGDLDIIRYLCANLEQLAEYGGGEKAIFRAIRNGHNDCVKELLTKYDIETRDRGGNTILLAAVAAGNREAAEMALERNASLEALNNQEESAFFVAIKSKNPEMIDLFENSPLNFNQADKHGVTLPMLCIQTGNAELLRKTLTDENINRTDDAGRSALFYACRGSDQEIFDLLLERKASLRVRSFTVSPLREAIVSGNSYAVEKLLEAGIAIEGVDDGGNNALMLSAQNGNLEIFQLLAAKNFRLFDTNRAGKNAREIASAAGHKEIADRLYRAMETAQLEQIKPQADALLHSSEPYEKRSALLDELAKQAGTFQKAKDYIETVRAALRRKEREEASSHVAAAIASAQKDKYYESAIRTLEEAIARHPKADNLDEARQYLTKLKQAQEAEKSRQAELRRKRERVNRMSRSEIRDEATAFIDRWMGDMRREVPTGSYWTSAILCETLYDVKSWEVIGVQGEWSPMNNTVIVQVESSTKGGIPIRKNWKVFITRDDDLQWKILSMSD